MRQFLWVLFAAVLSSVLTYSLTLRAQARSAQVVTDNDSGIIRFVIDGQDVARLSQNGLLVEGVIEARLGVIPPTVGNEPLPQEGGNAP